MLAVLYYGFDGRIVCMNCGCDVRAELDAIRDQGGDGEEVAMRVTEHVDGKCKIVTPQEEE